MAINGTSLRDAIKAALDVAFGALTGDGNTNRIAAAQAIATPVADAVNGGQWVSPPATATSAGTAGQMAYAAPYLYVCVDTNTWRRVALSTWP